MASRLGIFTNRFLFFANIITGIIFLLACFATPYLDPGRWWFISLLALAFPFLLFFMILFLLLWLFIKPKYSLISAVPLLLGFKSIGVFFAFHISHSFQPEKDPNSIRIVSWNVARFIELKKIIIKAARCG